MALSTSGPCLIMGEEGGPEYKWSYAGSLLFAVTVITTIGESMSDNGKEGGLAVQEIYNGGGRSPGPE